MGLQKTQAFICKLKKEKQPLEIIKNKSKPNQMIQTTQIKNKKTLEIISKNRIN